MSYITPVKKYLAALVGKTSLEDIIQGEIIKTDREAQQCVEVIRSHKFQKHMADTKLAALSDWIRMEQQEAAIKAYPPVSKPDAREKKYE